MKTPDAEIEEQLRAVGDALAARLEAGGLAHEVAPTLLEYARTATALRTVTAQHGAGHELVEADVAVRFARQHAEQAAALLEQSARDRQNQVDIWARDLWRAACAHEVQRRAARERSHHQ